jgi:hypothetical protein
MAKTLMIGVLAGLFAISVVQAATLDISIAAQGTAYNDLVADAKLRGDFAGALQDANLGNVSGGSNRFYANYFDDGVTLDSRMTHFLQRFDVSSIPVGSIINSAFLTTFFGNDTANNRTFTNVKLSQLQPGKGWVEGVGENPATDGSVTWNNQVAGATPETTIPWGMPGATSAADIILATTQIFDLVGVDGSATAITRDITPWVQTWVNNPASNTGMLWWGGNSADSDTGNRRFLLGSKEDGPGPAGDAVAAAPTLVIDYTVVPEPGTIGLLVAGLLAFTRRRRKAC